MAATGTTPHRQENAITNLQSLDEIRADAFRCWSHGVADRGSAFRSPALVTVGPDGRPQVRTVVLRGFDPAARVLTVHSDVRAAKVAALRANPDAALHVWDDDAQVQIRVDGTAAISVNDNLARTEWERLHEGSRAAYRSKTVPATAVEDPAAIPQVDDPAAFAQFAVLRIRLDRLEWLHLAHEGQRRARFVWSDGALEQHWLAP